MLSDQVLLHILVTEDLITVLSQEVILTTIIFLLCGDLVDVCVVEHVERLQIVVVHLGNLDAILAVVAELLDVEIAAVDVVEADDKNIFINEKLNETIRSSINLCLNETKQNSHADTFRFNQLVHRFTTIVHLFTMFQSSFVERFLYKVMGQRIFGDIRLHRE